MKLMCPENLFSQGFKAGVAIISAGILWANPAMADPSLAAPNVCTPTQVICTNFSALGFLSYESCIGDYMSMVTSCGTLPFYLGASCHDAADDSHSTLIDICFGTADPDGPRTVIVTNSSHVDI